MNQSDLLSQWKKRKSATAGPARIAPRPEGTAGRPSNGQQRLFLLQQLYPGNRFYQYAHRYDFRGPLDEQKLAASLQWVLDRHEGLRTNFHEEGEDIRLTTWPAESFDLERAYLSDLPEAERSREAQRLETAFTLQSFDLEEDFLFRALLIRRGSEDHRLLFSLHHIIGDRGSLQQLEHELFEHYETLLAGREETKPPLTLQFADYAYWEKTKTIKESHYDYWRGQLAGEIPLVSLPQDRQRPAVRTFRGKTLERHLDPSVSELLRGLARRHDTTPNVVFLAVLNAFLYRYTGQEDILVGSPVSTRDRLELEQLIGFLNETVVLRKEVNGHQSLNELIGGLKQVMEDALAYKDVPFEWLVKELKPDRKGGVNPFFQTMFVYNAVGAERKLPAGLSLTDEPIDLGTAKFDLTLFATDYADHFGLGFEYAEELFDADTVATLARHFEVLLKAMVAAPDEAIGTRELLDAGDRKRLLVDLNPTVFTPGDAPLIPDLLAKAAPNATAVSDGNESLTYAELNARADCLARRLLAVGIAPGEAVGLYCGRSPDLLVGIVGIMRAGGAYVPLDPEYPAERIAFIGADAGAKVVVKEQALKPELPTGTTSIDIPREAGLETGKLPTISPEQNAYLIYTSGSTGKPKGIPITHANLAHSTAARFRFYAQQPGTFLLLSSFAFDSSVAGIFWSLAAGGNLLLSPRRAEQDPAALGRLISKHRVTHTLMLPSLYQLLLEFSEPADLSSLQVIMVAGEACPSALVKQHFRELPAAALVNEYGPTEGTVWSTAHLFRPEDAIGRVPIGRPIPGMGHLVLDRFQQLVPGGVAGELYLSGPQLTKGYHGKPDLTAAAFFNNPFSEIPHDRLYKTGDLVRYRKDGTIDFLGRGDSQVKIRGHRIEPSEVSNAISRLQPVREAVVRVTEREGSLQLVAYFTVRPGASTDGSEIAAALHEQLPAYMVPAIFVSLEEFSRLPNGKVDLKNLPAPDWDARPDVRPFEAPTDELERQLAILWEKNLGYQPVGRHDNFFDIGGDSLKSIRVIAGAKKMGISLAPHLLFNHQTVAELATVLRQPILSDADETGEDSSVYEAMVLLRKGGTAPPLFCLHSGGGHVFFYRPLATLLGGERSIYAIQPPGLAGEEKVYKSVKEMTAAYIAAIREVQPHGPYNLLGTCFSNAVALEMARQLRAEGEEIANLFIIDSAPDYQLTSVQGEHQSAPAKQFVKLLKAGDWPTIYRSLRKRSILAYRKAIGLVDEQKRNLYTTIGHLNRIYLAYDWHPFGGRITFIRSTEFAELPRKSGQIGQWERLAEGGLDVHVVEGHHLTLFQPPEVEGLAKVIDECL